MQFPFRASVSSQGVRKLSLNSWPVDDIAEHCRQHIQKYRHRLNHDLSYCLELFRRAFEERSEEAFRLLYQTYIGLIYHWVYNHPYFSSLEMPADYYVADCMSHFFLSVQGIFKHFESVPDLLKYWQKCVNSIVLNESRKKQVSAMPIEKIEKYPEKVDLDERLMQTAIWQRIKDLLPEDKDRLLAHLIFVQSLTPKQIVEHYLAIWPQTNDVRVDRQRITRHLSSDSELRQLLRIDEKQE